MIVFLTLVYVAILAVLVWLKFIKLNAFWMISPVLWMVFLNVVLFIPMQWGAPAGSVIVFRAAIEIVPGVTGNVIEVPVEPLKPLKKDAVLFRIDPEPFQREVNRLTAALVEAEQQVPQLEATFDAATATVAKQQAEVELAKKELERTKQLAEKNAISAEDLDISVRDLEVAKRTLDEAKAKEKQARLAFEEKTAEGENPAVAQLKEQLGEAEYDLEQSVVKAPSDGYVLNLALRPGARVASLPMRSSVTFVEDATTKVNVAIPQGRLRYVKPGQSAEIVFKYLPGKTIAAKVDSVVPITSNAQVVASGVLQDLTKVTSENLAYMVNLTITDEEVSVTDLPGGAVGVGAIYTDKATLTHIIRKVMLRMQGWLNYVI
ncbi:HlyD family secretion protein [Calycomorphotria hydatis]|uniref:Inner membrane protein YiaV n=1 Tax=Calycomorphotria hydatis TaxID=2528027 RepID=A0A517TDQ4_9PLAN|nr:HlyD family secretion protein [Calycomorphotria hydatis]QDT66503.1 Inner membrane protein YiaV precursor [Calycomorphotria hydatis]